MLSLIYPNSFFLSPDSAIASIVPKNKGEQQLLPFVVSKVPCGLVVMKDLT
jgi:hypothetical protein